MKLQFRITSLSRESVPGNLEIGVVKVVATFRGPTFQDARIPVNAQPMANWNATNQSASIAFYVSVAEGAKLHIDQEFEAEVHGHRAHEAA